jgi:hypothetical protein
VWALAFTQSWQKEKEFLIQGSLLLLMTLSVVGLEGWPSLACQMLVVVWVPR